MVLLTKELIVNMKNNYCKHRIKLFTTSSLLKYLETSVLADFLSSVFLLNYLLNQATNNT